jgi:hypothetical protein
MSEGRPLRRSSVTDPEDLFERSTKDSSILKLLATELRHRSVPRAVALAARVRAALAISERPNVRDAAVLTPEPTATRPDFGPLADDTPPVAFEILSHKFGPNLGDDPASTLAAWTALEVLSPQTYQRPEDLVSGDRWRIDSLANSKLPWSGTVRSKPNYKLYFQVVLGCVLLEEAGAALIKSFDSSEDLQPIRGRTPIATIMLDKTGLVLGDDTAVAASSFAWVLPKALKMQFSELARECLFPFMRPSGIFAYSGCLADRR